MKAIILAAGEGTRMRPITYETPKVLVQINGRPMMEYILEEIYQDVDEIIIVVKYLKEKIIEYFGDNFKGTKISYHEQGEYKGTGGAVMGIEFDDDVFILYGDGIFSKKDIDKSLKSDEYGCMVKCVEDPENYGIFIEDENGYAVDLVEKPKKYIGNLANYSGFKFSKDIFKYIKEIEISERGEYEITCALKLFMKDNTFKLHKIEHPFIDVGCPEDIKKAEKILQSKN